MASKALQGQVEVGVRLASYGKDRRAASKALQGRAEVGVRVASYGKDRRAAGKLW